MRIAELRIPAIPKVARHLVLALALAGSVAFVHLLLPLDVMSWIVQARAGSSTPSKDIVLVKLNQSTIKKDRDAKTLLSALSNIEEAGADQIFLDVPSGKLGAYEDEFASGLNDQLKSNLVLVGRYSLSNGEKTLGFPIDPKNWKYQNLVVMEQFESPIFDYNWTFFGSVVDNGRIYNSFAKELAGRGGDDSSDIPISYQYDLEDFQTANLIDVSQAKFNMSSLAGKKVVIGYEGSQESELVRLPKAGYVAQSFAPIFAAESLKSGGVSFFDRTELLMAFFVLLAISVALFQKSRWIGYACVVSAYAACLIAPIFLPLYLELSATGFFLLSFAGFRIFNRWRGSIEMKSGQTGLPTLKALTRQLETEQIQDRQAVIAVKLHGLSEVLAVLGDEQKLEYFDGISRRLKIANKNLEIYSNDGEHLVWSDVFEERGILEAHLLALRAIFAQPLEIGGKQVDVTVTFSADLSFTDAASRRIANAIALVDKTSLADMPLLLGTQQDAEDREWQLSLQSSIDNALKIGAIFAVFQPKINLTNGQTCGYEALVRWKDEERGFISPAYFIEQCEQAGRMGKLTRFMLKDSVEKFQASEAYQYGGTLSVNVSSTMLSNTSLPEIVCEILEAADFPEERLIIEVTETARIHDQLTARSVLSALAAIGVGISLDDFGTGTAGLETLYNYPFSEMKIDRTFVKDIATDTKARAICEQVVNLGRKLNMNIVAEGIEDQRTLQILTKMGCPVAQGYYLGRPSATPAIDMPTISTAAKN